ncbi:MFS general substrate transporter [Lentinus tigrinus ALCF2SS1-7]|uniref:MFS general substrate transporter n=1 Tax=Lentinus tigrinus ALCF2SS1-7 TaxID=1328758 RepID=UPI0011660EFF|nr:MFS general substrate transporter [Lentinus tigrinus ALCF2SS1-7]
MPESASPSPSVSSGEKPKTLSLPPVTTTTTFPSHNERSRIRLTAAFFALLTLGWGDGVTGTLLPYFKRDFNLSFMTSSLLFVASAVGYALGTLCVEFVTSFLGRTCFSAAKTPAVLPLPSLCRRKLQHPPASDASVLGFSIHRCRFLTLAIMSVCHSAFFMIMGSKSGFPSMLVAYAISAFSRSFILGENVYVCTISKRGLGYMYGSWAIGAFCAPLVCQSIIATGIRWANFYFGSLVLSAINTSLLVFAFCPTRTELLRDADFAWALLRSASPTPDAATVATKETAQASPTQSIAPILQKKISVGPRTYSAAVRKPKLWASAIFSMIYTGSESSTQGFIVIYLLSLRSANPNTVGYVTSGFWGGMAISRFLWGYLGSIVTFRQRKWIIQGCISVAFCMHLLIWFVPSFIENAVSAAVVGLVYGPIYPANISIARDLLPAEVHLVSLAIVAAFGSFGAALFPFITGTLSTAVGPRTLPIITVSQCVAMFGLWTLFPSQPPEQL